MIEVKTWIQWRYEEHCRADDEFVKHSDHLATIAELTRERDGLREVQRWIPVSEKFPEKGSHVLVVRPDDERTVRKIHFIMWGDGDEHDFSHWMASPDFPELTKKAPL